MALSWPNWSRYVTGIISLLLLGVSIPRFSRGPREPAFLEDIASPYSWCAAGDTYAGHDGGEKAGYAYQRAAALGPNEGPVLMRTANFLLAQPDRSAALPYFAHLLQIVPEYDGAIFGTYLGMNFPARDVLERGLPADKRAGQAYFGWQLAHASPPDVALAWRWLMQHSFADERVAGAYAGFLLRAHLYADAASMWAAIAGQHPPGDAVFNGGFERSPLRSPLDWNLDSPQAQLDASHAKNGTQSLKIEFNGAENIDFHHVWQSPVVQAGPHRFAAFVKTEGITTDQGIEFHVYDPEQPARFDQWIGQLTGTHDWTRVEKEIVVPSGTHLLMIQICRRASRKFDNKVAGIVWIDSVSLTH